MQITPLSANKIIILCQKGGFFLIKKITSNENEHLTEDVMRIINTILTLDKSPEYELSKHFYEEHGTFIGLEEYLKNSFI